MWNHKNDVKKNRQLWCHLNLNSCMLCLSKINKLISLAVGALILFYYQHK